MRHLELLNVALALRYRQPGFPVCLEDGGYQVLGVGTTLRLSAGEIAPDVIACSASRAITLLIEVKGGIGFELDQFARMLHCSAIDLRDLAYLPIEDPASHGVHVVYVCNEAQRTSFAEAIGDRSATIVGFDGTRFRLAGRALPDVDLAACLTRSQIGGAVPLGIIPFDADSPDEEVARAIIPQLVSAAIRGEAVIKPRTLVSRTHHLVHGAMESTGAGSELAKVEKKVTAVLTTLQASAFRDWIQKAPKQDGFRWVKALPTDGTRTRELLRLRKAASGYFEAIGAKGGIQLPLFESEAERSASDSGEEGSE